MAERQARADRIRAVREEKARVRAARSGQGTKPKAA